jgi:hypothetical protein
VEHLVRIAESITAGFILNYVLVPLVMTTALGGIARLAFHKLTQRKEQIAFGGFSFLIFLTLMIFAAGRAQEPKLAGAIQSAIVGRPNSDRTTFVVLSANIINSGTMQSIVKSWRVTAESNGRKYEGAFAPMPDTFTFNDLPSNGPTHPTAVTYHNTDNIVEKSLAPVQVGGLMTGILFIVFQNIDAAVFATGVDFIVTYEDVLSKPYSMQIKTNGSMGAIAYLPGVKMDAKCPIPTAGLPRLGNDLTGSVSNQPFSQGSVIDARKSPLLAR